MPVASLPPSVAIPSFANSAASCSGAAPLSGHLTEQTSTMVDGLARSIAGSEAHRDCGNELDALIDIATFKDPDANSASCRAEQHLLNLYANPEISSAVRKSMIERLLTSEAILARGRSPDAKAFAMPASLLHLAAQHARNQMAMEEQDVVTDPVHLEEMKLELERASGLTDELDIADTGRFVTTDEMLASFAALPGACPHIINLSDDVCDKAEQMQFLLDIVPDEGFALAPLLVNEHFMLIAAEKTEVVGKYALSVANTYLPIHQAALDALPETERLDAQFILRIQAAAAHRFSETLTRQMLPGITGKVNAMRICSNHLQAHAINSCGPLVSMMAESITAHKNKEGAVGDLMQKLSNRWRCLESQQQKDAVIAHRAKMIGNIVEWRTQDRFVNSGAFRPKPNTQTEVTHL